MRNTWMAAGLFALAMAAGTAAKAEIVLTFDELNGAVNETVDNYYAGGFGGAGTGPGVNHGIVFSHNTITGCNTSSFCSNTNADQSPSQPNIIFFLSGAAATMNVAAGFDTGFSFFYSSINVPAFVNVYDGLDGTGSILATLSLAVTPSGGGGCLGAFCPFVPIGVTFNGVAHSVDFGGTENQVAFDNITLGSEIPGGAGVPEPASWAMMLAGFAGLGGLLRTRRQLAVAA
jgi:hypothetical protein